jgi:hypothetical protein
VIRGHGLSRGRFFVCVLDQGTKYDPLHMQYATLLFVVSNGVMVEVVAIEQGLLVSIPWVSVLVMVLGTFLCLLRSLEDLTCSLHTFDPSRHPGHTNGAGQGLGRCPEYCQYQWKTLWGCFGLCRGHTQIQLQVRGSLGSEMILFAPAQHKFRSWSWGMFWALSGAWSADWTQSWKDND